ncbi:MAG: MBL fold metallo-hydrolase [Vicinamibacterales bacterium]|jgi:glyoxylase-like metal-dependent hydrolase (beta-lactamase superfamily II)|nr:MBL fold metallo-hydrolase [Vicinamibacterales bacterium]
MQTIARGITYTDLQFLGLPRVIATAVLQSPAGVALVDPGPSTCLDTLRAALIEQGIPLGDVRTLLLTHIHLDHAGATGTLVRDNPDIQVYVHERGAPHMADPAKLLSSAGRLYGDDMDRLWGEFLPVPQDNLHVLSGGERITAADRELDVAYTPGHASHHVSFFDRSSGVAFVGDTAGIRTGAELFAMPPTPPPDIDIDTWKASVALIDRWQAETLFVTHFGPYENPSAHLAALVEHLDGFAALARTIVEREATDEERVGMFTAEARLYLQRHIPNASAALYDQAAPLSQCWLGLARYWKKRGVGAA